MATQPSIEQLRIYRQAEELERSTQELITTARPQASYDERQRLWRSITAVSHYIYEAHGRYSYALKLEALHNSRQVLEQATVLIRRYPDGSQAQRRQLADGSTILLKQIWGLIKYLRAQQQERAAAMRVRASNELVASR